MPIRWLKRIGVGDVLEVFVEKAYDPAKWESLDFVLERKWILRD